VPDTAYPFPQKMAKPVRLAEYKRSHQARRRLSMPGMSKNWTALLPVPFTALAEMARYDLVRKQPAVPPKAMNHSGSLSGPMPPLFSIGRALLSMRVHLLIVSRSTSHRLVWFRPYARAVLIHIDAN
jgi:hypothetical protein